MYDPHPPRALGAEFTTAIFARIGVDRYTVGESALGPVYLGWTARGVSAVRLAGSAKIRSSVHQLVHRPHRPAHRARARNRQLARAAQTKLCDTSADDVPIDFDALTPFERTVLGHVAQIRPGYARP